MNAGESGWSTLTTLGFGGNTGGIEGRFGSKVSGIGIEVFGMFLRRWEVPRQKSGAFALRREDGFETMVWMGDELVRAGDEPEEEARAVPEDDPEACLICSSLIL